MANTIHIRSSHKEVIGEKARLSFQVVFSKNSGEEKTDILYYEVEKKYLQALCDNLIDGIVVTFLSYAVRGNYDFVSAIGISEELYYNLTYHCIPQFCCNNPGAHYVKISAPIVKNIEATSTAVAAGMSLGVDSFCTLYEYTEDCQLKDYRITHLTYFENGAHHMGKSENYEEMQTLFHNQQTTVRQFCEENRLELIVVSSNLNRFLSDNFWVDPFERTHTFRNIGTALMLQKLIKTYYYSSAYNIDEFSFDLQKDSARYEKYLIPHIRTSLFKVYSSNGNLSRLEKTKYISQYVSSYDYLNVCFMDGKNCGKCLKCIRTMLTLDIIGRLEQYRKSFDVDHYRRNQNWYYTNLFYRKNNDAFTKEVYEYAIAHGKKFPLSCRVRGFVMYLFRTLFLKCRRIKLISKIAYKYKPY